MFGNECLGTHEEDHHCLEEALTIHRNRLRTKHDDSWRLRMQGTSLSFFRVRGMVDGDPCCVLYGFHQPKGVQCAVAIAAAWFPPGAVSLLR